ncbi:MAG TPA: hypothetical protein VE934_01825 [Polaromonas sp.]|uniref:hypothetical protein n=1 Tax=Polaromonas sp. TaxID=1869339 RepID=UPI002D4341D2|nr:hypothetical protein [Polaromonas sp.]HYW55674.1 hypothetical protein [Polaromonas sp.]
MNESVVKPGPKRGQQVGPNEDVVGGLLIRGPDANNPGAALEALLNRLNAQDLSSCVQTSSGIDAGGCFVRLTLAPAQLAAWAPGCDTLQLSNTLHLATGTKTSDLQREIVLTLLMGPEAFEFPGIDELVSAVRIRVNIVQAARLTMLDFKTITAERPADCWAYREDCGFVRQPGVPLITALIKATQPDVSGTVYSFSCYRATEYVILLGMAQELAYCNPPLLDKLQERWALQPIMSGQFHDVFLREQGSMDNPLPPFYFVPGDRVWFRNPDSASSEASGYEGSWVFYLGNGLFSNFWKRDQPFTLATKCLEIYHWRNALYRDAQGDERIDELKVEALVAATAHEPTEAARIQALMQRYREPRGVYRDGGCLDTTREFVRWVCPGTTDIYLPD